MHKKEKNENYEMDINSLINDLKSLPAVKIPPDFDDKLRYKIAFKNTKRESKSFSYSNWVIYGFSICIILCVLVSSFMLINNISSFKNKTLIHDENKVKNIIPLDIPIDFNKTTGSLGKTVIGSTEKKDKYLAIPDSNVNLDSLKIDSIKIEVDSKKVSQKNIKLKGTSKNKILNFLFLYKEQQSIKTLNYTIFL